LIGGPSGRHDKSRAGRQRPHTALPIHVNISCHDRSAQNCQISCLKCAACTRTQALRRRRISLHQESDGVACSMRRPVETLSPDNVHVSGSGIYHQRHLSKKVVATLCLLYFDTKSEQSGCNKSSDR